MGWVTMSMIKGDGRAALVDWRAKEGDGATEPPPQPPHSEKERTAEVD